MANGTPVGSSVSGGTLVKNPSGQIVDVPGSFDVPASFEKEEELKKARAASTTRRTSPKESTSVEVQPTSDIEVISPKESTSVQVQPTLQRDVVVDAAKRESAQQVVRQTQASLNAPAFQYQQEKLIERVIRADRLTPAQRLAAASFVSPTIKQAAAFTERRLGITDQARSLEESAIEEQAKILAQAQTAKEFGTQTAVEFGASKFLDTTAGTVASSIITGQAVGYLLGVGAGLASAAKELPKFQKAVQVIEKIPKPPVTVGQASIGLYVASEVATQQAQRSAGVAEEDIVAGAGRRALQAVSFGVGAASGFSSGKKFIEKPSMVTRRGQATFETTGVKLKSTADPKDFSEFATETKIKVTVPKPRTRAERIVGSPTKIETKELSQAAFTKASETGSRQLTRFSEEGVVKEIKSVTKNLGKRILIEENRFPTLTEEVSASIRSDPSVVLSGTRSSPFKIETPSKVIEGSRDFSIEKIQTPSGRVDVGLKGTTRILTRKTPVSSSKTSEVSNSFDPVKTVKTSGLSKDVDTLTKSTRDSVVSRISKELVKSQNPTVVTRTKVIPTTILKPTGSSKKNSATSQKISSITASLVSPALDTDSSAPRPQITITPKTVTTRQITTPTSKPSGRDSISPIPAPKLDFQDTSSILRTRTETITTPPVTVETRDIIISLPPVIHPRTALTPPQRFSSPRFNLSALRSRKRRRKRRSSRKTTFDLSKEAGIISESISKRLFGKATAGSVGGGLSKELEKSKITIGKFFLKGGFLTSKKKR